MGEVNTTSPNLVRTAKIVAAFVAKNAIGVDRLPDLISTIHKALNGLSQQHIAVPTETLVPAVPINKSVTSGFIVCLEDGKKFKSMKRHLANLGMSPDEYRAKWGLPAHYPMVAPQYAAIRSALAISNRLGRRIDPVAASKSRASKKADQQA